MNSSWSQLNSVHFYLWFSEYSIAALEEVSFRCHKNEGTLKTVRGKTPGAHQNYMSFQWSSGVRAAASLVLRTFAWSLLDEKESVTDGVPILIGEQGSLAASLDYAISKQTNWLLDMFGCVENGDLIARELFLRSNPDRKRPGPVVIRLNLRLVATASISVFKGGRKVKDPDELVYMAEAIENNYPTKDATQIFPNKESLCGNNKSTLLSAQTRNSYDSQNEQNLTLPQLYRMQKLS